MGIPEKLKKLIQAYLDGLETQKEYYQLKKWFQKTEGIADLDQELLQQSYRRVQNRLSNTLDQIERLNIYAKYRVLMRFAASILLLMFSYFGYQYYTKHGSVNILSDARIASMKPHQEAVKLTFDQGKVVQLVDSNQQISGMEEVQSIVDGEIVYNPKSNRIIQNTISTPKGNLFKVTLPDGTSVWMNANTSLSFPSRFTGNIRQVRLSGEAYFEVVKNPKQPFVVKFEDQEVKVMGTHFNIKAYPKDPVQMTTLMEGRVLVKQGQQEVELLPNQQAINQGQGLKRRTVEASEYLEWREGYFVFHNASPNEVMAQLSRWYDLDVQLTAVQTKQRFSGKIRKDMNLLEILKVLKLAHIDCEIVESNQNKTIQLNNN